MRVPFPIKVFLALVLVLAAGTVPTYIFIETSFVSRLVSERVEETAERASVIAEVLRPMGRDARLARLQQLETVLPERLTYLGPTGVTIYDTENANSTTQDESPEVLQALGRGNVRSEFEFDEPGVGAAQRESAEGLETIFVAVKIDESGEVLRLSFEATDIANLTDSLRAAFRNGQALGLSFALVLSVIAAFVFMRPLQRLVRSAQAIARGDYTASQSWNGSDEIGDVGLALNTMARELRQRLATAHASETLLVQAAEFLELPLAVIEREGDVIVINGAFRRLVEDASTDAEEVVAKLIGSKKYGKAYTSLRSNGGDGRLGWTRKKIGVVLQMHLLERPGTDALVMLTSVERDHAPTLPASTEVRAMPVRELVDRAIERARAQISSCEITVDIVEVSEKTKIVEVEGRVELALAVFIEGAARGTDAIKVCLAENDLSVELWVDGEVSSAPVRLVRHLLTPCGGRVEADEDVSILLARA